MPAWTGSGAHELFRIDAQCYRIGTRIEIMASVDEQSPKHSILIERSQNRKRKRTEENGQTSVSRIYFVTGSRWKNTYIL